MVTYLVGASSNVVSAGCKYGADGCQQMEKCVNQTTNKEEVLNEHIFHASRLESQLMNHKNKMA